jgi:RND family efflux transporter MFP subunit
VTAHAAQRGEVVAEVMGTGTLESHVSATISPKISGLVTAVLVDQGDRVEPRQILARLDDSDLSRQVEVAESTLAAASAAVERQEADRARALAVLDQARYDYGRVEDLVKQNTAAAVEFEDAKKTLRVSEADVARADAALVEAQKQVIAAEKTLEFQKAKLADTVVRAPFAGLIARRDRDPGDVVMPGGSVLLLVSTDELWISAWVDETEMARLRPGQRARAVFRAEAGRSYPGEVARLGREVDRETREFLVDVRVRELPENWAVGQRAEVYIETGRKKDVAVLPTHFVVWRDGKAGTFVEDDGHAEWRPLRLGLRGGESVEVAEGLNVGERVIAPAGQAAGLKPGQRVAPALSGNREPTGKQP